MDNTQMQSYADNKGKLFVNPVDLSTCKIINTDRNDSGRSVIVSNTTYEPLRKTVALKFDQTVAQTAPAGVEPAPITNASPSLATPAEVVSFDPTMNQIPIMNQNVITTPNPIVQENAVPVSVSPDIAQLNTAPQITSQNQIPEPAPLGEIPIISGPTFTVDEPAVSPMEPAPLANSNQGLSIMEPPIEPISASQEIVSTEMPIQTNNSFDAVLDSIEKGIQEDIKKRFEELKKALPNINNNQVKEFNDSVSQTINDGMAKIDAVIPQMVNTPMAQPINTAQTIPAINSQAIPAINTGEPIEVPVGIGM